MNFTPLKQGKSRFLRLSEKIIYDRIIRSYEDLYAQSGMNHTWRSSRYLTVRSFENQLIGYDRQRFIY